MKGFALYSGRKLLEIGINRQTLLGAAWIEKFGSLNMPSRFLPCDEKELAGHGFKLRPIQFARLVEDGQKGNK